jgi:hypothetical protein
MEKEKVSRTLKVLVDMYQGIRDPGFIEYP